MEVGASCFVDGLVVKANEVQTNECRDFSIFGGGKISNTNKFEIPNVEVD
jgi:hypothetical protein